MPNNATRSRELRRIAREFLEGFASEQVLPASEHKDIAGSLVRQWLTYNGTAVLLLGEPMFYVQLGATPLGRTRVNVIPGRRTWEALTEDWRIDPSEVPQVMERLNLAQSAEVTNLDGERLRVWVDPGKRSRGVESLDEARPQRVPPRRDYRKMAGQALASQLGSSVPPDEMEELTQLVAAQWKRHDGHACIILNASEEVVLTVTEQAGGCCNMTAGRHSINRKSLFASLGFAPEAVSQVIGRLNLGQRVQFRDRLGTLSVMWYDPKARRVQIRPAGSGAGPQQITH
jgi:hypothetical protein